MLHLQPPGYTEEVIMLNEVSLIEKDKIISGVSLICGIKKTKTNEHKKMETGFKKYREKPWFP